MSTHLADHLHVRLLLALDSYDTSLQKYSSSYFPKKKKKHNVITQARYYTQ